MINVRTIRKLNNDDGLTLKNGKIITYKTGWQVADYGVEAVSAEEAMRAVKMYNGNCGVWYSEGIYYIDHSFRVSTKKKHWKLGALILKYQFSDGQNKFLRIAKIARPHWAHTIWVLNT